MAHIVNTYFQIIECRAVYLYPWSASPLIRQISERSLPISLVTYLRFFSVIKQMEGDVVNQEDI